MMPEEAYALAKKELEARGYTHQNSYEVDNKGVDERRVFDRWINWDLEDAPEILIEFCDRHGWQLYTPPEPSSSVKETWAALDKILTCEPIAEVTYGVKTALKVGGVTAACEGDICRDCMIPDRCWTPKNLEEAANKINKCAQP